MDAKKRAELTKAAHAAKHAKTPTQAEVDAEAASYRKREQDAERKIAKADREVVKVNPQAEAMEAFSNLAYRWEDEKEYEDWADYVKVLRTLVPKNGTYITCGDDPFRLVYDLNGQRFMMVVRGDKVVVESVAKQFKQSAPLRSAAKGAKLSTANPTSAPEATDAPAAEPASNGKSTKSNPSHTSKEQTTMTTATKSAKSAARKNVAKKQARKIEKSARVRVAENPCQCGCGARTFKNFAPGHDAKLVGMIKRGELKKLSPFQADFAKAHGIKLGENAKPAAKKVRAG